MASVGILWYKIRAGQSRPAPTKGNKLMLAFTLKALVILSYWTLGCHLFFTDHGLPRYIYGGLMNIPEAIGLIFMAFALFILFFFGRNRRGA